VCRCSHAPWPFMALLGPAWDWHRSEPVQQLGDSTLGASMSCPASEGVVRLKVRPFFLKPAVSASRWSAF
jgi:hypothetical protein